MQFYFVCIFKSQTHSHWKDSILMDISEEGFFGTSILSTYIIILYVVSREAISYSCSTSPKQKERVARLFHMPTRCVCLSVVTGYQYMYGMCWYYMDIYIYIIQEKFFNVFNKVGQPMIRYSSIKSFKKFKRQSLVTIAYNLVLTNAIYIQRVICHQISLCSS